MIILITCYTLCAMLMEYEICEEFEKAMMDLPQEMVIELHKEIKSVIKDVIGE